MSRRWLLSWIIALVVCSIAATLFERWLRDHDYRPTLQDDRDLWSMQMDRLGEHNDAIALLGASRIQYAVDPALVAQFTARPSVMLAVNGAYPMAALRALAEDPAFHGVAVVGIDSRGLSRRHWDMQRPWFEHYQRRWTLARRIHRALLSPLQAHLVFMRAPFAWVQILRRHLAGYGPPINDYVVVRSDRLGLLDYRRTNVAAIRERRIADLREYYRDNRADSPQEWLAALNQVSDWVRAIQARGGKVVFFREPSAGEHLMLDEANYPRELYWDAYARVAPMPLIDFRDEPAFAAIALPDTSHIDGRDVPRFTRTLLDALVRRGIVTAALSPG
ncbi:MAG: hypothetical protein M3Z31_13500 [Pseudomonadota bacterium]|nr:hypothetical protein [Pseudomonadota bacterium]